MTEKLKQLMHERAESVHFTPPDLAAMTRAGDRVVRRRRVAAVGGVAATAVLFAAAAGLGRGPTVPDVAVEPATTAPVVWTTGATLHRADGSTTDLGHDVQALVRTARGYVFSDPGGAVWSWSGGAVDRVGLADPRYPHLVSDDESTLAGWVDVSGDAPVVRVLDQATGDVTAHATVGRDPSLVGIDAATAYWQDARGAVAVDLATGDSRVVDPGAAKGRGIGDVENGLIAFTNVRGESATVVGPSFEDGVALDGAWGTVGAFSPDGRWYSSEGGELALFDTRTGDRVTLPLSQRFATGYEWLDATTLAVLAADRPRMDATAQLLTCSVPDGACELVVADLGTFEELEGRFALPVGEPAG